MREVAAVEDRDDHRPRRRQPAAGERLPHRRQPDLLQPPAAPRVSGIPPGNAGRAATRAVADSQRPAPDLGAYREHVPSRRQRRGRAIGARRRRQLAVTAVVEGHLQTTDGPRPVHAPLPQRPVGIFLQQFRPPHPDRQRRRKEQLAGTEQKSQSGRNRPQQKNRLAEPYRGSSTARSSTVLDGSHGLKFLPAEYASRSIDGTRLTQRTIGRFSGTARADRDRPLTKLN